MFELSPKAVVLIGEVFGICSIESEVRVPLVAMQRVTAIRMELLGQSFFGVEFGMRPRLIS